MLISSTFGCPLWHIHISTLIYWMIVGLHRQAHHHCVPRQHHLPLRHLPGEGTE